MPYDKNRLIIEILKSLKNSGKREMRLFKLAKSVGFRNPKNSAFKGALNYLEEEGLIKTKEGVVLLLADFSLVDQIEIAGNTELKEEETMGEDDYLKEVEGLAPEGLVPILTPMGNISYISKKAYILEKNLNNFWRPLRKRDINKLKKNRELDI
jgi:hypothetical protein